MKSYKMPVVTLAYSVGLYTPKWSDLLKNMFSTLQLDVPVILDMFEKL